MALYLKRSAQKSSFKVGYKNPPMHTRFKKGLSGNPAGRPKGDKNSHSILKEILKREVKINKNGVPAKVEMLSIIWTQLVNKAAEGDLRAISKVIEQVSLLEMKESERAKILTAITKNDKIIIGQFLSRNKEQANDQ
jgi:hypothetical protein